MKTLECTAAAADKGRRLDAFLAAAFDLSRSAVERLLGEGAVTVTPGRAEKNYRITGGEHVTLRLPDPVPDKAEPENIPLDIVYEDGDIAVINKPAGLVVHPAAGNERGTLVNALLYHCGDSLSGVGGVSRPGIVHRIDKDTSGLLVIAKNDRAHQALSAALKVHDVARIYEAVVLGNIKEESGTVDAPVGRNPADRKKMAVVKNGAGRAAVTHYTVIERFGRMTHVRCQLETGRTHQIRVHMAHIGHPLLGDPVYGGNGTSFERLHKGLLHGQCLHAGTLSLTHPTTGERMTFSVPPPPDFETVLQLLRKEADR